jgi:hypothetical protein
MSESQNKPPQLSTRDQQAKEEGFVLKALLALFVIAGLIIALITLWGGGVVDD